MSFGRDLVKKLKGDELKDNPLEMICLSPAILDLKLSHEQLHTHCLKSAKDLLAELHPDKHSGFENPALKRYAEAFNLLKDRQVFDKALAEFREAHSYKKREEITVQQQISNLKDSIKFFENQIKEERIIRKEDEKIRKWAQWYLAAQSIQFSSDKIKPLSYREQLAVVSFQFKFSTCPFPPSLTKFKENYGVNPFSREKITILKEFFNENKLGAEKLSSLINRAFKSNFKTPAIRWSFELGARELGFKELAPYLSRIEKGGVIRDISMETWSIATIQKYRKILIYLSSRLGNNYVIEASIFPGNVNLGDDKFLCGDLADKNLYVLGTIEPDIGFAHIKNEKFGQSGNDTSCLTMEKNILSRVEPFLSAERALVCIRPPIKRFSLSANNLKVQWNNLNEKRRNLELIMPALCLSHIIVDM